MLFSNSLGKKVDFDVWLQGTNPRSGKFGTALVKGLIVPSRLEVITVFLMFLFVLFLSFEPKSSF